MYSSLVLPIYYLAYIRSEYQEFYLFGTAIIPGLATFFNEVSVSTLFFMAYAIHRMRNAGQKRKTYARTSRETLTSTRRRYNSVDSRFPTIFCSSRETNEQHELEENIGTMSPRLTASVIVMKPED